MSAAIEKLKAELARATKAREAAEAAFDADPSPANRTAVTAAKEDEASSTRRLTRAEQAEQAAQAKAEAERRQKLMAERAAAKAEALTVVDRLVTPKAQELAALIVGRVIPLIKELRSAAEEQQRLRVLDERLSKELALPVDLIPRLLETNLQRVAAFELTKMAQASKVTDELRHLGDWIRFDPRAIGGEIGLALAHAATGGAHWDGNTAPRKATGG